MKQLNADKPPVIAITGGDINGIGPELIVKTFLDNRMLQLCTPVVYSSSKVFAQLRKMVNVSDFGFHQIKHPSEAGNKNLNLINVTDEEVQYNPGNDTEAGGKVALLSLQKAVQHMKEGAMELLVTAPINKHNIQSEQFKFNGHTEFLAKEFEAGQHIMMLVSDDLRVATLTGHIPLNEVSKALSPQLIIDKVKLLIKTLLEDFEVRKPRIALLGLNPHAGDKGLIGAEEEKIIIPAIEKLKQEGHIVNGPYAADGFFGSGHYRHYDVVVSMYHDQGLIPFKTLSFNSGVNYTAGLSIIRTSPDHGTAYDLAGRFLASEESLRQSIYLALDIHHRRKMYQEISADPLKVSTFRREREFR
jgi:4-hydroxythreonine-4-phosphate dehydrogenase